MNFSIKFLEKVSVAEGLTILFIFGVGVSFIFKTGFYNSLGVDWYISNLNAQQLLLSTIGIVACTLLGFGLGVLKWFIPGTYWQIPFTIVMIVSLGAFALLALEIQEIQIESMIFLFSLNVGVGLSSVNNNVVNEKGILLSELKWDDRTFLEKISGPLIVFVICILFIYLIYNCGERKAAYILEDKYKKTYVKTKSDNEHWILVEMNGDKVLLMSKKQKTKFKIIESKNIEFFKE